MSTQNASMRWRLVVYAYKNPYPKAATPDEAVASIVEQGVVSISINRSKNNPEGVASITMVGPLPKAIFHGNWVIIRSRVGDFLPAAPKASGLVGSAIGTLGALAGAGPGPDPTMTEGIPRFIGQINSVETTYAAAGDSGLVTRVHTVRIREWSHVFRQQVKFDLFDLVQNIKPTADSTLQAGLATLAAGGLVPTPTKSLKAIAESVVNPFQYATIALAMVAGINKNAATKAMASDPKLKSALDTAAFYSNIATRMPSLPKSMLIDMGLGSKADPSLPFAGEASLVLTLLGNQKPGIGAGGGSLLDVGKSTVAGAVAGPLKNPLGKGGSGATPIVPTFKDAPSGTFNGVFQSEKEIINSFKVPTDRPVSYGSLGDFSQEFDLWSLLQARCDSDLNEMFTDIWYHKDPTNESRVIGRPVLVIRDKPFLFDDTRKTMALQRKWTSFDDLPKVFIPSGLITDVATSSTFNGAPNYIRVNLKDPLIKDDAPIIATAQTLGRSVDDAAQSRYGGIFFSVDTAYLSKEGSAPPNDSKFDVSWWSDVGQVVAAWYGSRYLLPSGTLRLKDNNIPIMVGCNIVFKMGEEAQYVAHVEAVSFSHSVNGSRGDRTTTTSISFSHLATYDKGKAYYMGSESVQDLYKKSKTRKTSFLGDLAALLGTVAALEAVGQGLETAKQAISVARKLEKLFQ